MTVADGDGVLRMLTGLLEAGHVSDFDRLPELVAVHAAAANLRDVRLFLSDLRDEVLREVTGRGPDAGEGGEEIAVDGTFPGQAFRDTTMLSASGAAPGMRRHWVPVIDGTERIGLLRVDGAEGDAGADQAMWHLASLVALLVVSKRPTSDAHARLVRTRPMNVAAEMQWNLMPPMSCATGDVVIAAAMEPVHDVGGDAFDYALADGTAHFAIFDAMGHDSSAGLTANLAVAAARNERRQGADLARTGERIEQVLLEQFGGSRYATGVLAELDVRSGVLRWVNRGHHPPVLIRGSRWTTTLVCPPTHPMGTNLGLPTVVCTERLEPGDRLLLYTDGITEARDARGREFGIDRFTDFVIRQHAEGLPVPEMLRRLMRAVLAYHRGRLLDDATVIFVEWRGTAHNTRLRPGGS